METTIVYIMELKCEEYPGKWVYAEREFLSKDEAYEYLEKYKRDGWQFSKYTKRTEEIINVKHLG